MICNRERQLFDAAKIVASMTVADRRNKSEYFPGVADNRHS